MTYRYIVVVDSPASVAFGPPVGLDDATLAELKIRLRLAAGRTRIYACMDTPLIRMKGGIVLGHLFNHNGDRIVGDKHFPTFSDHASCVQHLIGNYWGEYVLVWVGHGDAYEASITRDPSGGVRCVYSFEAGTGFVTSDPVLPEGFGLYRREVDWEGIALGLNYPHVSTQRTALMGITELLPGRSLHIRNSGTTTISEWSPWMHVNSDLRHGNLRDATEDVRQSVRTSVRAWANVDRKILVELSGGLDSSIVTACLQDTSARVTCSTLLTPVPGADEREYAAQAAADLGVALHHAPMEFNDARFEFLPPTHLVRPRINALQYAINQAIERVGVEQDTAAYYSGGGGDTVFGYLGNAAPAVDALRERGLCAGISAIRDLSELHGCTHWTATRLMLKKLIRAPKSPWRPDSSFLDQRKAGSVVLETHPWLADASAALPGDRERIASLAVTQVFRDTAPRSERRCLRLPLLSQPVVESTLRVPSWMSIIGGQNRSVARAAFADVLPPHVHARRSKGNFLQYCGSMFQRNRVSMREFLLSGELQARGLLDGSTLAAFLDSPAYRDNTFMRVIDLCMIENWVRHQR
ncbi:asparagine synthase C-terminal domain-containing protein [Luteimonas sp. BDR2-5]|uniref:asparagine synthase-related protein n=1 Tax=Proluteimonas luteida TaxID=2878685 RepID=UPI001E38BA64|nr:asparagine synthase-related protein [Luteimonas sp. BDR2-5]MCD9026769.1 asparagine synthase C-terminal domain-containing protein [Luteimonas sp. BDR2-5]